MKRFLLALLALTILVPIAIVAFQTLHDPGSDEPAAPVVDRRAQAARGAYLARAGNCMACHTARGGAAYAGGRPIATPFGDVYASNITPDRATGIGAWTADDFWRALHNGKSKDGSFLYPAFPYTSFTKVTRADSDALFAYLGTIPPVARQNRPHDLHFPFNQRILLAFWRTLYFEPGTFREQPGKGAEWNRGAYLVQGLGHCSACHTARDFLGGTTGSDKLAGGMIPMQNWYASSLTADPQAGLADWTVAEVAQFLQAGVSSRGAVFGPMAEVVAGSLQHLSNADVEAMAVYLKSMPSTAPAGPRKLAEASPQAEAVLEQGRKLYETHCADCHGKNGKGAPPAYPPLAGARSLTASSPVNPVRIVLLGGFPPSTERNPQPYGMPPFAATLNDAEVAAVVSYVRTAWGNQAGMVSPIDVVRLRGVSAE
ncbi:MAG: c-type cytochrome [Burkholderiaceae bacterium]